VLSVAETLHSFSAFRVFALLSLPLVAKVATRLLIFANRMLHWLKSLMGWPGIYTPRTHTKVGRFALDSAARGFKADNCSSFPKCKPGGLHSSSGQSPWRGLRMLELFSDALPTEALPSRCCRQFACKYFTDIWWQEVLHLPELWCNNSNNMFMLLLEIYPHSAPVCML